MCGIAGIIKYSRGPAWAGDPQRDALKAMAAAIAHRGPDGQGMFIDPRPDTTAALLHSRLAILDLPGGQQPMSNETGDVHVVFNGEIYNHAELRRELQSAGHKFRSDHSDTEVLVHGWEQWGAELPSKLLGMFAFAVWDSRDDRRTLFLARDRMGQKPLFYATLEDGIVFGSTIPAVLAWPEVPRRVPKEQIALYLKLGYLPAPQTIFRDISQLLPGSWLQLQNDVLTGGRYWTPMTRSSNRRSHISDLRPLLAKAVVSQLIADTPIACFLSGGIDSSIIATLAQQARRAAGGDPLQTVSVGFSEAGFDESAYAQAVADRIGSRHTRIEVNPHQEVMATLELLMATTLGQPFADSSIIPTYHLSKAARQIAPVAISGDGADELFAGYDRYRAMLMLFKVRWQLLRRFLPKASPVGSLAKKERYRRFAAAAKAGIPSEKYTRLVELFPHDQIETLLGEPCIDYFPLPEEYGLNDNIGDLETRAPFEDDFVYPTLRFALIRDQSEYLPGDVLWKVDSASMSPPTAWSAGAALEVRSPFLDHNVVEFANALHEGWLIENGKGKQPLRRVFGAELPAVILDRSKKGFGVPIGKWFNNDLLSPLTDMLFAQSSFTSMHLHKPTVEKLLREHFEESRDHTHRLFALLTLELFWRRFAPTLE